MSMRNYRKGLVLFAVLLFILAGYVSAGEQEIQEKLNKEVKVELKDVTIAEALDKIGEEAGVEIELSDEAEWKLPQGGSTRISVLMEGSLSEGLSEMLNSFFMRYAVGDEKITIYPQQVLERIIGRPNTRQLELLKKIYCAQFSVSGSPTQEAVLKLIKSELGDVVFSSYDMPEKFEKILKSLVGIKTSTTLTFAVLLDQYCDETGLTWYISEMKFPTEIPQIKVVKEEEFCEARLDQIVDFSFHNEIARSVIEKLGGMAGVEIIVNRNELSWLEQRISVDMQNTSIRQALINFVNTMDGVINFSLDAESIYIQGPKHPDKITRPRPSQTRPTTRRPEVKSGEYVGKISIPMDGGKYFLEFMLREGDLPEDLKALRDEKIKEILGKARTEKKGDSEKGGSDD